MKAKKDLSCQTLSLENVTILFWRYSLVVSAQNVSGKIFFKWTNYALSRKISSFGVVTELFTGFFFLPNKRAYITVWRANYGIIVDNFSCYNGNIFSPYFTFQRLQIAKKRNDSHRIPIVFCLKKKNTWRTDYSTKNLLIYHFEQS